MKKSVISVFLLVTLFSASVGAIENGWWWNPTEDGIGYVIDVQGDRLYMGWYAYDESGQPSWLASGGKLADGQNYYGPLWKWENGSSFCGMYQKPDPSQVVGYVSIIFHDSTHATITCCDGTVVKNIERFIIPDFPSNPNPNPAPAPQPTITLPEVSMTGSYALRHVTLKINSITLNSGQDFTMSGSLSVGPSTYTQSVAIDGITVITDGTYSVNWTSSGTYDAILYVYTSYGAQITSYVSVDGYYITIYARLYSAELGWVDEWDTWEKVSDSF